MLCALSPPPCPAAAYLRLHLLLLGVRPWAYYRPSFGVWRWVVSRSKGCKVASLAAALAVSDWHSPKCSGALLVGICVVVLMVMLMSTRVTIIMEVVVIELVVVVERIW